MAEATIRVAHRLPPDTLLADVGGTNARFLVIGANGRSGRAWVLPTRDHRSFADAWRHWRDISAAPAPRQAAIAVACPVAGDVVRFTNLDWHFSIDELRRELGLSRLVTVNDAAATAHALPWLEPADCEVWQEGSPPSGRAPCALVAPGTGLGVSALVPTGPDGWQAIAGEGGHVTLAGRTDTEIEVLGRLRARFGHVSAERALSGPGLANLYEAILERDGLARTVTTPEALAESFQRAGDARVIEAFALFADLLGTVAADMALIFGAGSGLFLGGGILPALGAAFDRRRFLDRFGDKGRFSQRLQETPVRLIRHPFPTFVGLAALLAGADGTDGATGTGATG